MYTCGAPSKRGRSVLGPLLVVEWPEGYDVMAGSGVPRFGMCAGAGVGGGLVCGEEEGVGFLLCWLEF